MERYNRVVSLIKPAPASAAIPPGEAQSPGNGRPSMIRIVNNPDAPAYASIDYDKSHPYNQGALVKAVNNRLPEDAKINSHDLLCMRRTRGVESEANFYHKGLFGPSQYSDALVDWLVEGYKDDPNFFLTARTLYREKNR